MSADAVKRRALTLLVAVFWLAVWQALSMLLGKPVLLPSPIETLRALFSLAPTAAFWRTVSDTLLRVLGGYALAITLGCLLAAACACSALTERFLSPIRALVKATPISSFIILVLLWLTKTTVPLFIAFLMVLPIVWTNVQQGILGTDAQLLEMACAYGVPRIKRLTRLYMPSVLPYLKSACATGLGFAWKSAIAAEVIARPLSSIGGALQNAKVSLDTEALFAWTLVVVLISMALERLLLVAFGKGKKA